MSLPTRIVDADSQFTRTASFETLRWDVDPPLSSLVESGCLRFGHTTFGRQHDTCVVILRRIVDIHAIGLFKAVSTECVVAFGGDPDLILYPGESTAAYLVFRIASGFGAKKPPLTVVMNPAFRAYGNPQLVLELSKDHPILKRKQLKILFFDDSISTGGTETSARKAFRDIYKGEIEWITFVVVRRGVHERPAKIRKDSVKRVIKARDGSFRQAWFCAMGPETLTEAECPFCPANVRLERGRNWAVGARQAVMKLMADCCAAIRQSSLERGENVPAICSPSVTKAFLAISSQQMHDICYWMTSGKAPGADEAAALLLFIAIHFTDVASYVSFDRMKECWMQTTETALFAASDILLVSTCALLPTSMISEIGPDLIRFFVVARRLEVCSAIAALIMANQKAILDDTNIPLDIKRNRTAKFISEVQHRLRTLQEEGAKGMASNAEVVERDINLVAYGGRETVIRLAHNISVLLGQGRHELFLWTQLAKLDLDQMDLVRMNLDHMLDLIAQFSDIVSAGLREMIAGAKADLAVEVSYRNVKEFQRKARYWLKRVWKESPMAQLFYWPESLHAWVEQVIDELRYKKVKKSLFCVHATNEADRAWLCFGPAAALVRDHFRNLCMNPINYFLQSADEIKVDDGAKCVGEDVLVQIVFARVFEHLFVIFADRADLAEATRLFSGNTGLPNARAQFNFYGGNVEYFSVNTAGPDLLGVLDRAGVDIKVYKNVFVSKFPTLLESR